MREITLTKLACRIVEMNVSQKPDGFKPREHLKWATIAGRLLDAAVDYDDPVQQLTDEAERLGSDTSLGKDERDDAIRDLNTKMRGLDATLGQETVRIVLEGDELDFVRGIWETLAFRGDRTTRARINAISSALAAKSAENPTGAVEVTARDGHIVTVETPAPVTPTPNGKVAQLVGSKGRHR